MILSLRNVFLALLLAVLVAANVFLEAPSRDEAELAPLFPGFAPARAARIEIEARGDGPASLELRRGEDGWTLVTYRDFPASGSTVEDLLARVANLSTLDLVGDRPSSHARFGVADGQGVRLRIADAAGAVLAELLQGRAPEGAAGSFVRPRPGDAVYRTTDLAPLSPRAGRWVDTRLVAFDPRDVEGITARLVGEDGVEELSLHLRRQEDGRWRSQDPGAGAASGFVASSSVPPLFRVLANLFFREISSAPLAGGESGFDPPRITVELDVGNTEPTSLWIGALAGEDTRYATDPHWPTPWLVTLPAASAEHLASALRRVARARR